MLDDKAPESRHGPPLRGSSFSIENILRSTRTNERRASVEDEVEHTGLEVAVESRCSKAECHISYLGSETQRLKNADILDWCGTSANNPYGNSKSECQFCSL